MIMIQIINLKLKQNPFQALNPMARIQTWGIYFNFFVAFVFLLLLFIFKHNYRLNVFVRFLMTSLFIKCFFPFL